MPTSMLCRFATLRVMPDPLRGECVNIGLVLFAVDGSFAACRLTDDWSRADALCGGDSSLYQEIARQDYADPINAGTFTLADFDRLRGNWGPYTTVGLTEGGASIRDTYADVFEDMYGILVRWPPEDPPWRKREDWGR